MTNLLFKVTQVQVIWFSLYSFLTSTVYETSLHLSILFRSPIQTSSTLSYLLPGLYLSLASTSTSTQPSTSRVPHDGSFTTLLSLLHDLLITYPSQKSFYERLASLPPSCFSKQSEPYRWIHDLARCLRTRNYARLEKVTQRHAFAHFAAQAGERLVLVILPALSARREGGKREAKGRPSNERDVNPESNHSVNLPLEALCTLVEALCDKARETAWLVLRTSYRELICAPPATGSSTNTSEWLARALTLRSRMDANGAEKPLDVVAIVDKWLGQRCDKGEIKRKEGDNVQGRWVLVKPPAVR